MDPGPARVTPLAEKSVASLKTLMAQFETNPGDVVRVNCFTSSVDDHVQVEGLVRAAFLNVSVSVMQIQSKPSNQFAECEAIGRLHTKPVDAVRLVNPTKVVFAQAAIVSAPKILFTTTFTSPTSDDAGVRAAFSQLKSALQGDLNRAFYVSAQPGTAALLDKYRALRFEFLDRAAPPASTNLVFDGPTLGIEAIALPK
jgi:enamine deaminase RidA (YjgF/YER057c/UK114 family)